MKSDTYRDIVESQLKSAKDRMSHLLMPMPQVVESLTDQEAKLIVGTYRIAIEPNFIPWMFLAYKTAKSPQAHAALEKNIADEISQDHPKMLRDFAHNCGVAISQEHYKRALEPVLDMWQFFASGGNLRRVAIAATLEHTSPVFIPYLAEIGRKLGCKDFTYTDVHGEADIEHARELCSGLIEEINYAATPWRTVATAADKTADFLESILSAK